MRRCGREWRVLLGHSWRRKTVRHCWNQELMVRSEERGAHRHREAEKADSRLSRRQPLYASTTTRRRDGISQGSQDVAAMVGNKL